MSDSSAPAGGDPSSRRLTSDELEEVIRRADELQAQDAGPGVADDEAVSIGQELGLDPALVRRAIAEVRERPPQVVAEPRERPRAEGGVMARVMGRGTVAVVRTVARPAHVVEASLQAYLESTEGMVLRRRVPQATRYVRGAAGRRAGPHAGAEVEVLDAFVTPLDLGSCRVELAVDLRESRTRHAALGGLITTGVLIAAAAVPGFVALGALSAVMTRTAYGERQAGVRARLESVLDRWSTHV